MTVVWLKWYEPGSERTSLRGPWPGQTQTRLCSHRRWLEAWNFEFRKKRDCSIHVAKWKALISCAVNYRTEQLICSFVFRTQNSSFLRRRLISTHAVLRLKTDLIGSLTRLRPVFNVWSHRLFCWACVSTIRRCQKAFRFGIMKKRDFSFYVA